MQHSVAEMYGGERGVGDGGRVGCQWSGLVRQIDAELHGGEVWGLFGVRVCRDTSRISDNLPT